MTSPSPAVLVRARPGGLLLDLETGALFRLNDSATFVWESWLAGRSAPEIAASLAERHGLALPATQKQVDDALLLTGDPFVPSAPLGDYRYRRAGNGYVFSRDEIPLLWLDEKTGGLTLADPYPTGHGDPFTVLMAIAPKLTAFRGHFVLHASAALLDGRLMAVCGVSGAGKTTTVRALVRAGAAPVSEDKLVVRTTDAGVVGLIEGEPLINAWVRGVVERLAAGLPATCNDLDGALEGRWVPLCEIGFIDSVRRSGESVVATELSPLDAAHAVFQNAFYGSDRPTDWERQLRMAAELASRVPAVELGMPAGLPALEAAAGPLVRGGSFRSK